MHCLKMNFKNERHLIQVLLLVKVTLLMMDHKISEYFNQFINSYNFTPNNIGCLFIVYELGRWSKA